MDRNFEASLKQVRRHEGGFVNHPRDPGGATNKGMTLRSMRAFINPLANIDDLKKITDAQVATIYRREYWDTVRASELPSGVDFAVFDFSINSGPGRAIEYLQKVVGVAPDRRLGPKTMAALAASDNEDVIRRICAERLAFLKRIRHPKTKVKLWPTFGTGWLRRVIEVEKFALELVRDMPNLPAKPSKHTDVYTVDSAKEGETLVVAVPEQVNKPAQPKAAMPKSKTGIMALAAILLSIIAGAARYIFGG